MIVLFLFRCWIYVLRLEWIITFSFQKVQLKLWKASWILDLQIAGRVIHYVGFALELMGCVNGHFEADGPHSSPKWNEPRLQHMEEASGFFSISNHFISLCLDFISFISCCALHIYWITSQMESVIFFSLSSQHWKQHM